ncbi:hypothetical protein RB595_008750 [Gaeumannomyces hyphopodioides]
MLLRVLLVPGLAALAAATPLGDSEARLHQEQKRQLGRLAGEEGKDAVFDYVIVGGGTAGLTLANRLSANRSLTVAVVEGGTFYQATNPIIGQTPSGDILFTGSSPLDTNPLVDWNIVTEPQEGLGGRSIYYARGKCLGGSSARNFMIYQRGTKQTYQKWADAVGDDSYGWDGLLPYFERSVEFHPPRGTRFPNATASFDASAFSPAGGPLRVSYPNYAQPFSTWLGPALDQIGIPPARDFNSGRVAGSGYCASTIEPDRARRDSSQTSFLAAAAGRSNLKVYHLTLARKILFDGDKRATGVVVSPEPLGKAGAAASYTLRARREVVLSAGALQSPQLLMLSGVGPRGQLEKFGIPVVADRPGVGQGMEDHVMFGPSWRVRVQTLTRLANDPVYLAAQFAGPYTLLARGPLSSPIADFLAWEKAPRDLVTPAAGAALDAAFPPDWPEIEYFSAAGYIGDFKDLLTSQPRDGHQYATILAGLVAPLSRGSVALKSADPADRPAVDPRWLTDPTDAAVAVAAYRRIRAAFASPAMRPVLADDVEYFPGPAVQTDDQLLATIRASAMTLWHAACTCRMGRADDPTAVVDSAARVIGVEGLRVVDASSFALLPPGHPQSTIYALAEKIADNILKGTGR